LGNIMEWITYHRGQEQHPVKKNWFLASTTLGLFECFVDCYWLF